MSSQTRRSDRGYSDRRQSDRRQSDRRQSDRMPVASGSSDRRASDRRPRDGRPSDGRPNDGRPSDGRPTNDGRPSDGRPNDANANGQTDGQFKSLYGAPGLSFGVIDQDGVSEAVLKSDAPPPGCKSHFLCRESPGGTLVFKTPGLLVLDKVPPWAPNVVNSTEKKFSLGTWETVPEPLARPQTPEEEAPPVEPNPYNHLYPGYHDGETPIPMVPNPNFRIAPPDPRLPPIYDVKLLRHLAYVPAPLPLEGENVPGFVRGRGNQWRS